MIANLALLSLLVTSIAFSKGPCDVITQDEANGILGGTAKQVDMGSAGCIYSVAEKGFAISITASDAGPVATRVFETQRKKAQEEGRFIADEPGMGAGVTVFSDLTQRNASHPAGKCGFIAIKGTKIINIHVSDSAAKADLAGKKEVLDKLRPLAKKIIERN